MHTPNHTQEGPDRRLVPHSDGHGWAVTKMHESERGALVTALRFSLQHTRTPTLAQRSALDMLLGRAEGE